MTITDAADAQINGRRVLQANLVVAPGASTLVRERQALIAVDTAAEHALASFSYWYASGQYVLHGDTYATRMIPGVYDLRYQRYWDKTNNTVTLTDAADTQVNARRLLNRCVAVGN